MHCQTARLRRIEAVREVQRQECSKRVSESAFLPVILPIRHVLSPEPRLVPKSDVQGAKGGALEKQPLSEVRGT